MIISCVFASLPMSAPEREQLKIELQQVNQQISQQTRGMEVCLKSHPNACLIMHRLVSLFSHINKHLANTSMLLQREACALASQPAAGVKWSSGGTVSSEQLSLELDHVELEIKTRTREIAMVGETRNSLARTSIYLFSYKQSKLIEPVFMIEGESGGP